MKNILIFGHSRAGKTSLAKRLKDVFGLNVINEDLFITTFQRAYPQLDINGYDNYVQTAINVTPFMAHYLCICAEHATHKTGSPFVADMTFFHFDKGIPLMQSILSHMNGLTLPGAFTFINLENTQTAEALFADIRRYDTPEDWTYTLSDDALRTHCHENVGTDPDFYEKWKDLGFLRYDVAQGRTHVFDTIVNDLKMIGR